jgi:uncharacterized protein (DUF1697 family)
MIHHICILRGINVGGHKRIKMDALRQMFIEMGFANVQTYIQSGNVIFSSEEANIEVLEKAIFEKIQKVFGFEVPVLVLTATEMNDAVNNNPYSNDPDKDAATIHLTFLSDRPNQVLLDKLSPNNYLPDEFRCVDKVIYVYCPNGYGNTKLNNTFFETKLKVTATCRNLKTSIELATLAKTGNKPTL